MDPDKNQPATEPKPELQKPDTPTPEVQAEPPVVPQPTPHPTQLTPNTSQKNYERPVTAWQPKVEAEAQPPANPEPSRNEATAVGTEVLEAAEEPELNLNSTEPATNRTPMVNSDMAEPIISSVDPLQDTTKAETDPMSDNQAKELFKEEPQTKKHFKTLRLKKAAKITISVLVLILIIFVGYLFLTGNHAASSYKKSSNISSYQESFSKIEDALSKGEVEGEEVEANFNKLKVLNENSSSLSSVFLGSLNPNYKKAQELEALRRAYKEKVQSYQEKFADYPIFIASLSKSYSILEDTTKLKDSFDYQTKTAEAIKSEVQSIFEGCKSQIEVLQDSSKPANLSSATKQLEESLKEICSEGENSLQKGPLTTLSEDQVGILTPEIQQLLENQLQRLAALASEVNNGSGPESFELNSLSAYQREAHSMAQDLKKEAEAIIST